MRRAPRGIKYISSWRIRGLESLPAICRAFLKRDLPDKTAGADKTPPVSGCICANAFAISLASGSALSLRARGQGYGSIFKSIILFIRCRAGRLCIFCGTSSNNIVRTLLRKKRYKREDCFFYNEGIKRMRWEDEGDFKAGSHPEILRKRRKHHAGDQGHQLLCAGGRVPWDHGSVGSGKTTMLNCISTIDTVSAGHIFWTGTECDGA